VRLVSEIIIIMVLGMSDKYPSGTTLALVLLSVTSRDLLLPTKLQVLVLVLTL
jgi:hypothetical protein